MSVGQVVELDNNREYVIFKIENNYICLMSLSRPVEILVTNYIDNKFEIITNKKIIKELLEK